MSDKKDALDRLMAADLSRRDFMKMSAFAGIAASVGGVVTLDLWSPSNAHGQPAGGVKPFTFAVIADQHTMGPKNNFMKLRTGRSVEEILKLEQKPDFVMEMGDMVHDGSDEQMKFFDELIAPIKGQMKFITGEHDWYLYQALWQDHLFVGPERRPLHCPDDRHAPGLLEQARSLASGADGHCRYAE